jgi:TRAP-type C4-dicarboxylate transport system substrate-binding protein
MLLAFSPLPAAAQDSIELKLTICTRNDPNERLLNVIKDDLEKRPNNRFKTTIYPGCTLGSTQRLLEGVQLGTIEVYATPPAFAVSLNQALQATDAPGLIKDLEHAGRTYANRKFREKFDTVVLDKGVGIYALWPHSTTNYVASVPLRKLDDFKGKKFRVLATKTELSLMAALGATGVPIDFSELLPALQAKTVDGVRSSLVAMAPQKYYDFAKYATVVNDAAIPIAFFTSMVWLNKLPADQRALFLDVVRAAEPKGTAIAVEFAQNAEKMWQAGGGEIIRLSEQENAEFLRRVNAVGAEVLSTNPATKDLYAVFKEAADATR